MRQLRPEVLVVGGGPAGSTAAHLLARDGHDVLLLDRALFPRDKICGDGLAPRSVAAVRRLGLEPALQTEGFEPLGAYRIISTWGEPVEAGLPSFGKGPAYTYVVPRRELDRLLLEAARSAGAEVRQETRALRLVSDPERPVVLAEGPDGERFTVRPRVVIAADGSRGSFSRTVVESPRLEPYAVAMRAYVSGVEGIDRALSFFLERPLLPGYGWIFPPSRPGDPYNVGVGMKLTSLRRRSGGIRAFFDWFVRGSSIGARHLTQAEVVSAPASFPLLIDFTRGVRRRGAVLFAGDTANVIDPLSGEGMAYAFECAESAAEVVHGALTGGRLADLASYEAAVWRALATEFGGAWLLREFLRRPWANGMTVRLMQRDDGIARGGMGVLSNSVPVPWLLRARVWRRVFRPDRIARVVAGGAGGSGAD